MEGWPMHMSVMSTNFSDLLLIAVDTPEGTNIVSVDEALGPFIDGVAHAAHQEGPQQQFMG